MWAPQENHPKACHKLDIELRPQPPLNVHGKAPWCIPSESATRASATEAYDALDLSEASAGSEIPVEGLKAYYAVHRTTAWPRQQNFPANKVEAQHE